jgi:hypothetical protein
MKFSTAASFALLILSLSGCKKVIHLPLHSSDAQFVIEGNVTNQPGPCSVKISMSGNYDGNNDFPKVSGALVVITDNDVLSDTLSETSPGTYITSHIVGVPGHTYQLYVNTSGKVFTASSKMPMPVNIDSVYATSIPTPQGAQTATFPVYTDPAERGNFYHFVQYINGVVSKDVYVLNDEYLNGTIVQTPLISEDKIHAGDTISVCLQNVDLAIYNYYFCQSINKSVATPANPVNNITGGSLGYFSAYSASMSKSIIAP